MQTLKDFLLSNPQLIDTFNLSLTTFSTGDSFMVDGTFWSIANPFDVEAYLSDTFWTMKGNIMINKSLVSLIVKTSSGYSAMLYSAEYLINHMTRDMMMSHIQQNKKILKQ